MMLRLGVARGALLISLFTLCATPGFALPSVAAGARQALSLGTSYAPPFSTQDEDGLFDRTIRAAFLLLGIPVELRRLPAERSLLDASAGVIDGDVGRVAKVGDLYPSLLRVPTPVLRRRQFVAFSACTDMPAGAWSKIGAYHVGFVNGWKLFEPIVEGARSVTRVETTEALFELLARDRLDLAFSARIDGLLMGRRLGMRAVCVVPPPVAEVAMYLFLNERHADIVGPVSEVLAAFYETGAMAVIRRAVFARYGLAAEAP